MQLNLSTDFQSWDNTEPAVLTSPAVADPTVDTIPIVKRRPLTSRELAASAGVYRGDDIKVLVPQALLQTGTTLTPGFRVGFGKDGSDVFTALEVTGRKRDQSGTYQTWELTCRNLVIAYGLNDLIDIQRASIVDDGTGTKVKTWPEQGGGPVLYAQVPARVQLLSEEVVEERGLKGFANRYDVIVAVQVPLVVYEDRIKWTHVVPTGLNGQQAQKVTEWLEIQGVHNPTRIDELPVIDAVGAV